MKALSTLSEVTKTLKANLIESAEKEAEILVRHGLDTDTTKIYRDNPKFSEAEIRTIKEMVNRRLNHEPLQYILGYEEFLGLRLKVGPGVLIPRPETELLAEYAIKTVASYKLQVTSKFYNSKLFQFPVPNSQLSILDIGTGSGCLALALAKEFPDAYVYGIDISETAIEYTEKNAEINGIKNVTFLKGNLFEPFKCHPEPCPESSSGSTISGSKKGMPKQVRHDSFKEQIHQFDLIISNPPYIRTEDIKRLQPEIKDWEPAVALDGGIDGLDFYRRLIPTARQFLKDNGILMLEAGLNQSDDIAQMLKLAGYSEIKIIKDYAGIERIIQARKGQICGETIN